MFGSSAVAVGKTKGEEKFPTGGGDSRAPVFPVEDFLFIRITICYLTWLSLVSVRG